MVEVENIDEVGPSTLPVQGTLPEPQENTDPSISSYQQISAKLFSNSPTEASPLNLFDIPDETLEIILDYLEPQYLGTFQTVSRRTRIVASADVLWQKFLPEGTDLGGLSAREVFLRKSGILLRREFRKEFPDAQLEPPKTLPGSYGLLMRKASDKPAIERLLSQENDKNFNFQLLRCSVNGFSGDDLIGFINVALNNKKNPTVFRQLILALNSPNRNLIASLACKPEYFYILLGLIKYQFPLIPQPIKTKHKLPLIFTCLKRYLNNPTLDQDHLTIIYPKGYREISGQLQYDEYELPSESNALALIKFLAVFDKQTLYQTHPFTKATPFHWVCKYGHEKPSLQQYFVTAIQYYDESIAEIKDHVGETSLKYIDVYCYPAREFFVHTLNNLKKAWLNYRDEHKETLLHWFANWAYFDPFPDPYEAPKENLIESIKQYKDLIHAQDEYGGTAIGHAVTKNRVELVRIFLEMGAASNSLHQKKPILNIAVGKKNKNIVKLLLEYGADPKFTAPESQESAIAVAKPVADPLYQLLKSKVGGQTKRELQAEMAELKAKIKAMEAGLNPSSKMMEEEEIPIGLQTSLS